MSRPFRRLMTGLLCAVCWVVLTPLHDAHAQDECTVSCDDDNACTEDSCDTDTGCVYEEVSCDDEDACTDDSCDAKGGVLECTRPVWCWTDVRPWYRRLQE